MKKKFLLVFFAIALSIPFFAGCFNVDFEKKYGSNITTYDIDLKLNDNNTIDGNQVVRYKNTTANILSEVYFHLYANSFSEIATNKPVSKLYESKAYPNGTSYGKIEIIDVNVTGNDTSFALENTDKDLLKVSLNTPLYPNDFISIDMQYKITIPNVLHRFGYNDNTINLGNIYPIVCVFDENGWDKNPYSSNGDPFYSNLANYNVKMTYPNKYTLAHSGNQTSQNIDDTTKTSDITAKAVRDFAMVLSDKFQTKSTVVDDTTINYYFYGDEKSDESLKWQKKHFQHSIKNLANILMLNFQLLKLAFCMVEWNIQTLL